MKTESSKFGGIKAIVSSMDGVQYFPSSSFTENATRRSIARLPINVIIPNMNRFVASENFVIDTRRRSDRREIRDLGINFKKYFLPKIETNGVPSDELAVHELLDDFFDSPIIAVLGSDKVVEITLGQFFAACVNQAKQESESYFEDGCATVGYIRDVDGNLKAVYGFWGYGGLFIDADKLDDIARWSVHTRVLSH